MIEFGTICSKMSKNVSHLSVTRGMAQQLSAFAALVEGTGSVPSTHVGAHTCL